MKQRTVASRKPTVSVLMPTFKQAAFISRAINSILGQTISNWELLIIDDASPDNTKEKLKPFLKDPRISYKRMDSNIGLGTALNYGLEHARGDFIAYLPSDDIYFSDHLESLVKLLKKFGKNILAYSGLKYEVRIPGTGVTDLTSKGMIEGFPLQLVQVMHRAVTERWMERQELVTDDLGKMFWEKLKSHGAFSASEKITSQWVDHPEQRHKIIQDPAGGINPYRSYYQVPEPLRFHSTTGSLIDEVEYYRWVRERTDTPMKKNGLKIALVGSLAFNPERILALEERGHKLYGLWTDNLTWFNTVGPVPFGHIEDIPREDWQKNLKKIKPDIIFAMLNYSDVPFAYEVLKKNPGIPFVWHFKEGPFDCLANGTWEKLLDLYRLSDGQIYCNREVEDWFRLAVPDLPTKNIFILYGDLAKKEWFHTAERSTLLSDSDGEIHTVLPGQPVGFDIPLIKELAEYKIHLHFYGDFYHKRFKTWVEGAKNVAPKYFHLHPSVSQEHWVEELSQYDAGWLHLTRSENKGDLQHARWEDLNIPARVTTLAAGGLPFIQYDNSGSIVATQALADEFDIGVHYRSLPDLAKQLTDKKKMKRIRENIWRERERFSFDYYADDLIAFFRRVIRSSNG
jgi:glycosyltransferase involved in cell wall biosynthesis